MINRFKNRWLPVIVLFIVSAYTDAQQPRLLSAIAAPAQKASPLDKLYILGAAGKSVAVKDANGKEYFKSVVKPVVEFTVGGALGRQVVTVTDNGNRQRELFSFTAVAESKIDDGGYYRDMFNLFHKGMYALEGTKDGTYTVTWNGHPYHLIVQWGLDNFHTMKGLQYFLPNAKELVDIQRLSQREDGMIYSFIQYMPNPDYYLTRDKYTGYSKKIGDKVFVRQPTENHCEYIYVNTIYSCWKGEGNDKWMKENLASAAKALDYSMHDAARWSKRFGLLKRVYTIDSWDFAVDDEYMPDLGITNSMIIDPVKSKFGVFFGDNTGYIKACYELAEMFTYAGNNTQAAIYKKRGDEIKQRLDALAWNGKFFTHFIDEDSTVVRKLGVDEKSQIAQSNAYSLNRDINPTQSKAIIETYLNLKNNLPVGSPGEWYAIYPPFQKGFAAHGAIWQYMNGGVGGHVAGELALGAYRNGYEKYGTDILNRLFELGKKYGNKIWFAYTGSMQPPPPPPVYKAIDLSSYANMDITNTANGDALPWMLAKRKGDDFHNLPAGKQQLAGIDFNIIDPAKNNRKSVVAVSKRKGFPAATEIPINDTAGCIYFLHTSSKPVSENIVGLVRINYEDGSNKLQLLAMEKQLTYWWFSELKTDYSGIAWYGKNDVSEGIGLSWYAMNNPNPQKKIKSITLQAPEGDGIYTLHALSLADKPHYVPVSPTSFGGPDNWAAATAMAAMVEGLAGIQNAAGSEAFHTASITPRWITTNTDSVSALIRFPVSDAYVAYQLINNTSEKTIHMKLTGSGEKFAFHILLPGNVSSAKSVLVNNKPVRFSNSLQDASMYVDFESSNASPLDVRINY